MDTKWKKFRNNTALKITCFLLTVILAGLCFFSASQVVAFDEFYKSVDSYKDLVTGFEDSSYANSGSFSDHLYVDFINVNNLVKMYKNDEYVDSGKAYTDTYGTLEEQISKGVKSSVTAAKKAVVDDAIDEFDSISNKNFVYDKECYSYWLDEYASDYSSEMTNGLITSEKKEVDKYGTYRGINLSRVIVDEKAIAAYVSSSVKSTYNDNVSDFLNSYRTDTKAISEFVNFKYAVVNRKTGEIYTNMEGVNSASDFKALVDTMYAGVEMTGGVTYSKGYNAETNSYYLLDMFDDLHSDEDCDCFVGIPKTVEKGDDYYTLKTDYMNQLKAVKTYRNLAVISMILCLILFVICAVSSGKIDENNKTKLAKTDKIYNDFHFIISWLVALVFLTGGIGLFSDYVGSSGYSYGGTDDLSLVLFGLSAMISAGVSAILLWLMSVIRNSRNERYFKHTFIYFLGTKLKHAMTFDKTQSIKSKIIKIAAIYATLNIASAICIAATDDDISFIWIIIIIILDVSLILLAKKTVDALDIMMKALVEAEKGNFDFKFNVEDMPLYLQTFGEHIKNLQNGMKIAVEEAVKGEKMKTALITNVSHDLKTPLTSIIIYTDLLKRCNIENESATGYIDILNEKAQRLKTLIEDLVEASKVTTGNVTLNIAEVNLNEMAIQISGENEDDLKALGIDLRINEPSEDVVVKADGQKTYRIIDNLFSNIKKYTMKDTRAYMEIRKEAGYGVFEIKNVSKEELNKTEEELMQRFVRGEDARTTEGAGLGLSIAKSLTELQNGIFTVVVDGDLFKAIIKLPLI